MKYKRTDYLENRLRKPPGVNDKERASPPPLPPTSPLTLSQLPFRHEIT